MGTEVEKEGRLMQQLKPQTLRRNFSWTFAGNVVYTACQWGMLVVLAKLGSPEMVGQFTLGIAITTPIIMFTNMHLRSVQITDTKNEFLFSDFLGLRLLSSGLALLAIAAITIVTGYRLETSIVILAIGFAKAFESISDVFYGLSHQQEQMDRIARSLMIKGPLSLLLLGLGVYLTSSVVWGAVGLAVAWALVLLYYDIRSGVFILSKTLPPKSSVAAALQPRWHGKTLRKLIWLALPLGFVTMLISLNTNIPRYFVERYLGERELGIFAAIAYLMVAGQIVVGALADSASPRLAKYYAGGNIKGFCSLLLKLVGIGGLLGGLAVLVAAVAGRPLLTLVYRPEYAQQAGILVWLMVAAGIGFVGSFLGYAVTAARYFRIQIPLFCLAAVVSAIGCQWLIPIYGLQGAAIALIITASVQLILIVAVLLYALHRLNRYAQPTSP